MEIKSIFKNKTISYFIIIFLSILAGLLVSFFSLFPSNTLWAFSCFSSEKLGFWIFTASLIVLFSEKRIISAVNAALYVYFMFLVTGISKSFRGFYSIYSSQYENIIDLIFGELLGWLFYGLIPAILCGVLAMILWQGRLNRLLGKIILILPIIAICFETIHLYSIVFTQKTQLFMALVDTVCLVAYIVIFRKQIFNFAK